jgi:hypothetical protein
MNEYASTLFEILKLQYEKLKKGRLILPWKNCLGQDDGCTRLRPKAAHVVMATEDSGTEKKKCLVRADEEFAVATHLEAAEIKKNKNISAESGKKRAHPGPQCHVLLPVPVGLSCSCSPVSFRSHEKGRVVIPLESEKGSCSLLAIQPAADCTKRRHPIRSGSSLPYRKEYRGYIVCYLHLSNCEWTEIDCYITHKQ